MKELDFNYIENLQGGNIIDGACAVLGLTDGAIAARFIIGAAVAIPGWGLAALAVGTIGCATYEWLS